jgi:hypothetical protein
MRGIQGIPGYLTEMAFSNKKGRLALLLRSCQSPQKWISSPLPYQLGLALPHMISSAYRHSF